VIGTLIRLSRHSEQAAEGRPLKTIIGLFCAAHWPAMRFFAEAYHLRRHHPTQISFMGGRRQQREQETRVHQSGSHHTDKITQPRANEVVTTFGLV
jgi:hypothetical protein